MSLLDDKKNVFTTIGAYTSLEENGDLPDTDNLFPSVNNEDDIGAFLLDVLGVVVGTAALKQLIGELFSDIAEKFEPELKSTMKKQLTDVNAGENIPSDFKLNGIDVPAKDIDLEGKLKTDPNSDTGKLIYDGNKSTFDQAAYNAIIADGTFVEYNNLDIRYNSSDDAFTFKPSSSSDQSVGDFIGDYIDDSDLINKKEFMSKTLDRIFGSISKNEDKNVEEISEQLKIDKLIKKAIKGDDDFTLSEEDIAEINGRASELNSGTISYDLGCGLLDSELSLENMTGLIDSIAESTDPNLIANDIENAIDNSFNTNINDGAEDENKETIRNGFFAKLFEFIEVELSKLLVTSPQARMLISVTSAFQNDGEPVLGTIEEYIESYKTYIKCVIKDILATLFKYIFSLIVVKLVALLYPIVKRIVREKINAYIGVIKSLISSKI